MKPRLVSIALLAASLAGFVSCGSGESGEKNVDSIVAKAQKKISKGDYKKALNLLCDSLTDDEMLASELNTQTLARAFYALANTSELLKDDFKLDVEDRGVEFELDKDKRHLVASFFDSRMVKVYDFPSMNERLTVSAPSHVYKASLSPDSTILAVATYDNNVYLYDYPSGKKHGELEGHEHSVRDVTFAPSGMLISCSNDHRVKAWDVNFLTELWSVKPHSRNVKSVAMSSDGSMIASCSNDGSVQTFYFDGYGQPKYKGTYIDVANNYVNDVAMSPDGLVVAAASGDEKLSFFDVEYRNLLGAFTLDSSGLSVAYSPDGSLVAVGTAYSLYIIDTKNYVQLAALKNVGSNIWSVDFVDNNTVIAGDNDGIKTIRLLGPNELVSGARRLRKS